MQGLLDWLTHVPTVVLYLSLLLLAAAENVFPPLPTDTVVAFGTWLAARGEGSALGAFLSTWIGNVAGAAGMYAVGRRHGHAWLQRRFPALANARGEERVARLYERYGLLALIVSRFVPGVRAVVPPMAGALKVPALPAIGAIAIASGIWYGAISWIAFRAGTDWDALTQRIAHSGRVIAIVAAILLAAGVAAWLIHRRRATVDHE